jgi:two-component sensor histidine kinase
VVAFLLNGFGDIGGPGLDGPAPGSLGATMDDARQTASADDLVTGLHHSPAAVAIYAGSDWYLDYANETYLAWTGRTLGQPCKALLHADTLSAMAKALDLGRPQFLRETFCETTNGLRSLCDLEIHPLPPGDRGEPRVLKISHDVTDRARNEFLLDAVMRYVPSGLTVALGSDVDIVRVSDYGARLLDQPRTSLENITAPFHPEAYRVYASETGPLVAPDDLPLTRAARLGEIVKDELLYVANTAGERIPVLYNAGPIRDREGRLLGGVLAWHDMRPQIRLADRLRTLLAEKETLLTELTHRVKNTLQTISSMLKLQAGQATTAEVKEQLYTADARVMAMAHVHNQLYMRPEVDGLADVGAVLKNLAEALRPILPASVDMELEVEPLLLPINRSTPFTLLANELITNAIKHAFPDARAGTVRVSLRHDSERGEVVFSVADNGVGLLDQTKRGFGLRIMGALAAQLGGGIELTNEMGTRAVLRFPHAICKPQAPSSSS